MSRLYSPAAAAIAVVLFAGVVGATWETGGRGRAGVGQPAVTGSAQKFTSVTPCARPAPPIRCLTTWQLERLGRRVAAHGGVRSSRYGDTTPLMRAISLTLVARAFPARTRPWALCIVLRESGANPGAISKSHDYGLAQIHVAVHPEYDAWRLTHDPGYSARSFAKLSRKGRDRQPWRGGKYAC
jgi:hypothetical protein